MQTYLGAFYLNLQSSASEPGCHGPLPDVPQELYRYATTKRQISKSYITTVLLRFLTDRFKMSFLLTRKKLASSTADLNESN